MSEQAAPPPPAAEPAARADARLLGAIERGGNQVPNPAILFLGLCVIVIVVSQLLDWADVSVTYQVVEAPPARSRRSSRRLHSALGRPPDASVQEGEYRGSSRPPRCRGC